MLGVCQERWKPAIFLWKKCVKCLVVRKKVVPLHPLSLRNGWGTKERVLWKIYIDRSSTRSECFLEHLGKRNKPFNSWILDSRSETDNDWIYKASRNECNESLLSIAEWRRRLVKNIEDIIYNEEFDPGSGWTLATGLTHASRGASWD